MSRDPIANGTDVPLTGGERSSTPAGVDSLSGSLGRRLHEAMFRQQPDRQTYPNSAWDQVPPESRERWERAAALFLQAARSPSGLVQRKPAGTRRRGSLRRRLTRVSLKMKLQAAQLGALGGLVSAARGKITEAEAVERYERALAHVSVLVEAHQVTLAERDETLDVTQRRVAEERAIAEETRRVLTMAVSVLTVPAAAKMPLAELANTALRASHARGEEAATIGLALVVRDLEGRRNLHAEDLAGWQEPGLHCLYPPTDFEHRHRDPCYRRAGHLVPTEPDPDERARVRTRLEAAIAVLDYVLEHLRRL